MGRVLLAQLPEAELAAFLARVKLEPYTASSITNTDALKQDILKVREQGYSIVDQELDSGLRSVAVSVFAGNGELLGAINISTNAARVSMETLMEVYLSRLQQAAEAIKRMVR